MELGATVCTVKSPSCTACPLGKICRARALTADETQHQLADAAVSSATVQGSKEEGGVDSGTGEQSCSCSVCRLDDDGLPVLPLAVTDFPLKSAKT